TNNIRIFTEFHYKGFIADLAIVKLIDQPGKSHLQEEVESVLAILEVKYKRNGNEKPFVDDVLKIKRYMNTAPKDLTQFYLAFIHEIEYGNIEESWLSKSQQKWAKGRLTELSGNYVEDEMEWKVLSYNGMNEGSIWNYRFTEEELKLA
ncbi:hypothetical protein RZN22_19145, partial [Bacillaceae bacterium S4-13-58]